MGESGTSRMGRKLLVIADVDQLQEKVEKIEKFQITDTYLTTNNSLIEEKIVKSLQGETTMYLHERTDRTKTQPIERKRNIAPKDYILMLGRIENSKLPIQKIRYCFSYNGYYYILDSYFTSGYPIQLLRIFTENLEEKVSLPPGVSEVADVTDHEFFFNSKLADKDWKLPTLFQEKLQKAIEVAIEMDYTIFVSPTD